MTESSIGIEQQRRNFKLSNGALYAYIRAFEQAKAYEFAGDRASGASSGEGAANRLWRRAGDLREILETARKVTT